MSSRAAKWVVLSCAGLPLLLASAACSKGKSETAKRAEKASGEMIFKESATATVESVDPENRVLTLREEDGDVLSVEVGPGVAIDRIEPEDRVDVAYQESVAFQLQEPGEEPTMEREATSERLPEGVQFGRRVTTTVEILSVAPDGASATFRVPEGEVRTVEIDTPENRERVAHLRPGDSVEVTYTERLAVTLQK